MILALGILILLAVLAGKAIQHKHYYFLPGLCGGVIFEAVLLALLVAAKEATTK